MKGLTLQKIVSFNNYIQLNQNYNLINKNNYNLLVETACKYRSKECFNILIEHSQSNEWLKNKLNYLNYPFLNYVNNPNDKQLYYIMKIINKLSYLNSNTMKIIIENIELFGIIFDKLDKNENNINGILRNCIGINFQVFIIIWNWLQQNKPEYFNQLWIDKYIISIALINDNLDVLKFIDSINIPITTAYICNYQINPILLSLTKNNCMYNCFEWLIKEKNFQCNHNLLWFIPCKYSFYLNTLHIFNFINNEDINHYHYYNIEDNCYTDSEIEFLNEMNEEVLIDEIFTWNYSDNLIPDTNFERIFNILANNPNYNINININIENIEQPFNIFEYFLNLLLEQIKGLKKELNQYLYIKKFLPKYKKIIRLLNIIKSLIPLNLNYNPLSNQNLLYSNKNKILIKNLVHYFIHCNYEITDIIKKFINKKDLINFNKDKYNYNWLIKSFKNFKKSNKYIPIIL